MPELPDVTVYLLRLGERVLGQPLARLRLASPFLLRSVEPPVGALPGKRVLALSRLGKRIVFELEDDLFMVVHLMIAGRFRWREAGAKVPGKLGLAAFDFPTGTLLLTEASTKKRASLHLVRGRANLAPFQLGGLEVLDASEAAFAEALKRENHTIKRALTDPRLLSGIGNAYSDEILHRARMTPMKHTRRLGDDEIHRLFEATRAVMTEWIRRLDEESRGSFPEKVTAFRAEMAVHGKFGQPCPVCGAKVQRVINRNRHADNETNYCPTCQTGGKLLADRALSRLLKADWPKTVEELEEGKAARRGALEELPEVE